MPAYLYNRATDASKSTSGSSFKSLRFRQNYYLTKKRAAETIADATNPQACDFAPLKRHSSMIMVVIFVMAIVADVMTHHFMSVGIVAVKVVADGMVAPVRMKPFPIMKARYTD